MGESDFLLSSDQLDVNTVIEDFFSEKLDFCTDVNPDSFEALRELGFFLMPIPENLGGLGMGSVSLDLAFRLCGKHLCRAPVQEHLYSLVIAATKTELSDYVSTRTATLNLNIGIPNTEQCDSLVVLSDNKLKIFEISDIPLETAKSMDKSRSYSLAKDLDLKPFAEHDLSEDQSILFSLCVCSELCGLSQEALELSVSWSKERKQFGKPIGSFQALQHKIADMHLKVEKLAATVRFAFWLTDNDKSQLAQAASSAIILARTHATEVIENAIQVHGGIGFTEEHKLHHYLRRAHTLRCYIS